MKNYKLTYSIVILPRV